MAAFVLLAIAKLVLVWRHTIIPIGYDDAGFALAARAGYWGQPPGPYAFVRQPLFPLFAWFCGDHNIPARLGVELVWIVAAGLLALALRTCGVRPWICVAASLATLFHPWTICWLDRLMQDTLYAPLTVTAVASLAAALAAPRHRGVWFWGTVSGLSAAAAAITRPEAILNLGSIGVAAAVIACAGLLGDRRPRTVPLRCRALAAVLLPLVLFFGLSAAVKHQNRLRLGVACSCELLMPGQTALYNALLAIRPDHPDPLVSIRRDVRDRAFAVSPTFAQLQPWIDGPDRNSSFLRACKSHTGVDGEYGAWTLWVIREAAYQTWHSPPESRKFNTAGELDLLFSTAASEIRAAMTDGRLPSRAVPVSMLPPEWSLILRRLPGACASTIIMLAHPLYERSRPGRLPEDVRAAYAWLNHQPPAIARPSHATREPPSDALEPIKRSFGIFYWILMPFGMALSIAALFSAVTRRRIPSGLTLLIALGVTALAARILLVALLDVTGIFLSPRYLLPAIGLTAMSAAAGAEWLLSTLAPGRSSPS